MLILFTWMYGKSDLLYGNVSVSLLQTSGHFVVSLLSLYRFESCPSNISSFPFSSDDALFIMNFDIKMFVYLMISL